MPGVTVGFRDCIRVVLGPDGWRWTRRSRSRHDSVVALLEWQPLPFIDRESAVLDALGLLIEDPVSPRRRRFEER